MLKPVTSEKAVRMIDVDNTLLFETDRRSNKDEIKLEVETLFAVKVQTVRTLIKHNKKFAYVRLTKQYPATDIASKLGML
jgi:ribosomal protein L23